MNPLAQFKHKMMLWGIFLMSCVDAVLTLMWIEMSIGEEVNPLLAHCLQWGPLYFVAGKIGLTVAGCVTLYLCRSYKLSQAATKFLFCFYSLLILYHSFGSAIILINK